MKASCNESFTGLFKFPKGRRLRPSKETAKKNAQGREPRQQGICHRAEGRNAHFLSKTTPSHPSPMMSRQVRGGCSQLAPFTGPFTPLHRQMRAETSAPSAETRKNGQKHLYIPHNSYSRGDTRARRHSGIFAVLDRRRGEWHTVPPFHITSYIKGKMLRRTHERDEKRISFVRKYNILLLLRL